MAKTTASIVGERGPELTIPFIQDQGYRGSGNFNGIQYTTSNTLPQPSVTWTANTLLASAQA